MAYSSAKGVSFGWTGAAVSYRFCFAICIDYPIRVKRVYANQAMIINVIPLMCQDIFPETGNPGTPLVEEARRFAGDTSLHFPLIRNKPDGMMMGTMKHQNTMTIIRDIFDFEIGYLSKSPCKACPCRNDLPQCSDQCHLLDQIRIILARGVSCSGRHPFLEP